MSSAIFSVVSAFEGAWDLRDRRVDGWPFMDSPFWMALLCSSYFVSAKFVGPRLMQNRQPFDLRRILLVYNALQIVSNGWIVYVLGKGWLDGNVAVFCDPGQFYSDPNVGLPIIRAGYLFFLIKFVDFFDTLCFILHKKNNHVSWLHVFHHAIMPIPVWVGIRFIGGSPGIFDACLNATIHVIMYTYYLLTGLGPRFRKFLFWKKYLTKMQIGQFVVIAVHSIVLMFQDCDIPVSRYAAVIFPLQLSFLFLFLNFYRQAYKQKEVKTA